MRLLRDIGAGIAGTLAVSSFGRFERRVLGHAPVYAPDRIAQRLLGRALGRPTRARTQRLAGFLMRWSYGPLLGAALGAALASLEAPWPVRGVLVGAGVMLFELLAMPAMRATPPLERWDRAELPLLAAHSAAFGLVAEGVRARVTAS
jgi:hypothetical protein